MHRVKCTNALKVTPHIRFMTLTQFQYKQHAAEVGMEIPTIPTVFL